MTDQSVHSSPASWIDDRLQQPDELPSQPQVDVISDPEATTVTFVSNRPEDNTTAAWITADVDLLVDVSETH